MFARLLLTVLLLGLMTSGGAQVRVTVMLKPGSPEEARTLFAPVGSRVDGEARIAEPGGGWGYRLAAPGGARCLLVFSSEGAVEVTAAGFDGKPLRIRVDHSDLKKLWRVHATAPPTQPAGARLRFRLAAREAPISVSAVAAEIELPDANGDGVPDEAERLMGLPAGKHAQVPPRSDKPHTSFQSGGAYRPEIGPPTDAAIAYTDDAAQIASWRDAGYQVQTMGGFRDGPDYARAHPGNVQTDANGAPITIGGNGYYLAPTPARIEIAKQYYERALKAGSTAVIPEEPEYWSRAGYEESFKQAWQERYGQPWSAPHGSVDARWRSEQLKGFLERRMIESILDDARAANPAATRLVAVHSPVTYYDWRIPLPHAEMLRIPSLQEIIGQVWTGTARTAVPLGGVRAQRTFELGLLEYSSLFHLARGSGRRMWFLMDPVEDDPNRSMEDYHVNYEQTLLAALMWPEVDSFEVMPWPSRIYGRVPVEYATEINTVVGALGELWRYPKSEVDAGSTGLGAFVADSMGWQRENPNESDMDGFYGLTMPFAAHGVPIDVLSLDRITEPGYLSRQKVLLVSYDFLKPPDAATNRALAEWTRRGGVLVLFGGTDAYNGVADGWWRKAGFASPMEALLADLTSSPQPGAPQPTSNGGQRAVAAVLSAVGPQSGVAAPSRLDAWPRDGWTPLASAPGSSRERKRVTVDLSPFVRESGSVCVRFEDSSPADGFGPLLASAELRIGGRLAASFRAGSEIETRFLAEERGTQVIATGRFADGGAHWTYRFDNLPRSGAITLECDMMNGYAVKARPSPPPGLLLEQVGETFDRTLAKLRIPRDYPVTLYTPPASATPLYRIAAQSVPAVWQAPVGRGLVICCGVAPGWLSSNAQAARWVREVTRHAFYRAGGAYREATAYRVNRGPYTAVRALGKPATVDGRWVDLLQPTLPIVEDPTVSARSAAFLLDAGAAKGEPRLLAASGRVRARSEEPLSTAFEVQAPTQTSGAARLYAGKRQAAAAKAFTLLGDPLPASFEQQGDSVLVRYPNDPRGVIVRVGWK